MTLEAVERSNAVYEALRSPASLMLNSLHSLVVNSQLYTLENEELVHWPGVTGCQLARGKLRVAF